MQHIVALSGGKDSTALALRLQEIEPDTQYTYIFTPTGNEMPEMIEHWKRLRSMLNGRLIPLSCGHSLAGLIRIQNALPNWRMRWCTRMLKIEPFQKYILEHLPCTVYVGIRADEADREGVDYTRFDGVTRRFPFVEWHWGIGDVLRYLECRGVSIPERTDCAACFFQTLYEWWSLWRNHPNLFAEAESWEAATGHTLRSEQRDSWPSGLAGLRAMFEMGAVPPRRTMKDRKVMCSFCSR